VVFKVTLCGNDDVRSQDTRNHNNKRGGVNEKSVKQTSPFARRKLFTDKLLLILETGCMFVGGTVVARYEAHKVMDRSNSVVAVSNSTPGIVVCPRYFVSCQPV
jgi:hypothetical protein